MSKIIKSKKGILAAAAAVGVSALALTAGGLSVANADSIRSTSGGASYVAVGSDTIQDLYNAFGNGYWSSLTTAGTFTSATTSVNGTPIASYDAFGPAYNASAVGSTSGPGAGVDWIRPKVGGDQFGRPHGSGDGVKALSAADPAHTANRIFQSSTEGKWNLTSANPNVSQLVDIARSSSRPGTAVAIGSGSNKLTFVPLAQDAVSWAGKAFPVSTLTTNQLIGLFVTGSDDESPAGVSNGDVQVDPLHPTTQVQLRVAGAWVNVFPALPQSASGTRQFFLTALNNGVTQATPGTWVTQAGAPENNASAIATTNEIIPFSAAQWIAQVNGIAPSTFSAPTTNNVALGSINGKAAITTDPISGQLVPLDAASGGLYGNGSNNSSVNPAQGVFARNVYSVVLSSHTVVAGAASPTHDDLSTLVTTTLPGKSATITAFGFLPITYAATGTTWLFSDYTN